MRFIKTLISYVLILAVMLTGCAGGSTSWVFENGGTKVSPGLYMIFESVKFSNATDQIIHDNEEVEDFVLPKQTELLRMPIDGTTVSEWVQTGAESMVREYYTVKQRFDSLGLSLAEQEILDADASVQSLLSQGRDFYDRNSISETSLKEYYYHLKRYDKLFLTLYGENGELAVPADEVKAYLKENFALVDAIPMYKPYVVPEGETKTLEELEADVKAKAESYAERLQAGEDIGVIAYEWQLESAGEEDKDTIEPPEKGDLSIMITEADRARYGDALTDAALGAQIGQSLMVDGIGMFIVIKRNDVLADPEMYELYKNPALRQYKYDDFNQKLAEWGMSLQLVTSQPAIKQYRPEKMKLDNETV